MTDFAPDNEFLTNTDFMEGPGVVTITGLNFTNEKDTPWAIKVEEFPGRPYKPGKWVGRILEQLWGNPRTVDFTGRRMELFRDPTVKNRAGDVVGGIRISGASHIGEKPVDTTVVPTRGVRLKVTIQPLADAPTAEDWHAKIAASESVEELRGWWQIATPDNKVRIEQRVAELQASEAGA